jgi:hypothetical protein
MPTHLVRAALLTAALSVLVAACSSAAAVPSPSSPPVATPPITGGTGNAGTPTYPELAVSQEPGRLLVSVADPRAKAWRIRVEGSGAAAGEVLDILLETSDVEFNLVVRSISGGRVVDENDLTGLVDDPTAAAGGCHPSLSVCYSSAGFVLPADGDGTVEVALDLPEPTSALRITGATSAWSVPFVLGPWEETESFRTSG